MEIEPIPQASALGAWLRQAPTRADRGDAAARDLLDYALLLQDSEQNEAAALLLDVASLCSGARPDRLSPIEAGGQRPSTWDIAVDELSNLISVAEEVSPPPDAHEAIQLALEVTATETADAPDPDWLGCRFGPAMKDLLRFRDLDRRCSDFARLAAEAKDLIEEVPLRAPIDVRGGSMDCAELATALAFNVLRGTLIRRGELARPPFGDPAIFQQSERLSTCGLGVGFRNVAIFAVSWLELEQMIGAAWSKLPREQPLEGAIERFAVLLSIGLPSRALRTLMDDLADAGMTPVLVGILIRLLREPLDCMDHDLMRTIRDAFLDLGHAPLAIAAQRRLTLATGRHPAEAAAQTELEASLSIRTFASSGSPSECPEGRIEGSAGQLVRLSGFTSTAPQRGRRFRLARGRRFQMEAT